MNGMEAWKETHVVNGVEIIVAYCPLGQEPAEKSDKVKGIAAFFIPYAEREKIPEDLVWGDRMKFVAQYLWPQWWHNNISIQNAKDGEFLRVLGIPYTDTPYEYNEDIYIRTLSGHRYGSANFSAPTYAEAEAECIAYITTEMQCLFDAWSDREAALAFAEGRPAPERRVFRLHHQDAERKEKIRSLEKTIAEARKELRAFK